MSHQHEELQGDALVAAAERAIVTAEEQWMPMRASVFEALIGCDRAASRATVLHRSAAVRGDVNGLMDEVIAAHLQDHVADPDLTEAAQARRAEELLHGQPAFF